MLTVFLFFLSSLVFTFAEEYELLVRQNIHNSPQFFPLPPAPDYGLYNENDPSAQLYSILDSDHIMNNLEDYRGSDGKFQFKLKYWTMNNPSDVQTVVFKQSNYVTESSITGFEPVSVDSNHPEANHPCAVFYGLARSDWPDTTYVDGNGGASCWWNSVGSATLHAGGIPGFHQIVAEKGELWILKPPHPLCATLDIDFFLTECSSVYNAGSSGGVGLINSMNYVDANGKNGADDTTVITNLLNRIQMLEIVCVVLVVSRMVGLLAGYISKHCRRIEAKKQVVYGQVVNGSESNSDRL